jgi:Tfp pilus assembly protein PilF
MKKMLLLAVMLFVAVPVFSQTESEKLMPVTTNSKTALSYYNKAMKYFDEVRLKDALDNFKRALDQDQDFFMANYQLAFYYILNGDGNNFNKYADAAINCEEKISNGEGLLKEAIGNLKNGQTNVVNLGNKLVSLYPNDPNSYSNLVTFQSLAGDSTGMILTLNKAIKIATKPATFYNQLGYAYMTLNESDKAEAAFNKYMELDPKNPNVYDSKGDYFMFVKKYDKAYESYMTAYSMDPSFSHDKADMAKHLYEQTEGKTLEIKSL